jgi:hypothetical protein
MSFWFFGHKRAGRRSLYSVTLPIYAFPAIVALAAMAVIGLIRGCAGG